MYRIVSCLYFIFLLSLQLSAQQFLWTRYDTAYYTFNPDYVKSLISVGADGRIHRSSLAVYGLNYGTELFGTYQVSSFDSSGNSLSVHSLGPRTSLSDLAVRADGQVMVCGNFMDTLSLDGVPLLTVNNPALYARNVFLLCFGPGGNLLWARNLSDAFPVMEESPIASADPSGHFWYAQVDFFAGGRVVCVGATGADSVIRSLPSEIGLVSDLSFDSSGATYLAGAVGQGNFTIGGLNVSLTETYNKFLVKFGTAGDCRWFRALRDITFDRPRISVDDSANIYFASSLFDSLTVDGFFLNGPQWVYDLMAVRFDSSGVVRWAIDVPSQPTITGDLQIAAEGGVAAATDGCYLLVSSRGEVDLGNGVVIGSGQSPVTHGMSVVRFADNGLPYWQLEVTTPNWVNPQQVMMTSSGGYLSATGRGDLLVGTDSIDVNTTYSFFSFVSRFREPAATGIQAPELFGEEIRYVNPSCDGRLQLFLSHGLQEISITDIAGRLVFTCSVHAGSTPTILDTRLPDGLYIVHPADRPAFRWMVRR